jgi:hypothetical protein
MTKFELFSLVIAGLAFIISIASLYLHFQDKPLLKIISEFVPSSEYGPAYIAISIINAGKRPLIVRMLGGNGSKENWVGEFLGNDKKGLRLAEKERHDIAFYKKDMVARTPDEDVIFCELWVEDSLGKRYTVPNSKKYLSNLLNN